MTGRQGHGAGRLDLCAQRQSLGPDPNSTTSWPGWSGCGCMPRSCWQNEEPVVLMGDYNIIPEDKDAAQSQGLGEGRPVPAGVQGGAAADRKSGLYRRLPRPASAKAGHYTFWDYFGSWERNNGIRIDHILLSPQALDRLKAAASTRRCAAPARSRPIMFRYGASWISELPSVLPPQSAAIVAPRFGIPMSRRCLLPLLLLCCPRLAAPAPTSASSRIDSLIATAKGRQHHRPGQGRGARAAAGRKPRLHAGARRRPHP